MSRPLPFAVGNATLLGAVEDAGGRTGVIIVTGGVQTRFGAHRGLKQLGQRLAARGYPVLRYERRGVGDSDGTDPGFLDAGDDLAAAVGAFRSACPHVTRIVGWGLCDGAALLALEGQDAGLDGLMLANPWTSDPPVDDAADIPTHAPAALRRHYLARLRDPRAWARLLSGGVDLRQLRRGLGRARATDGTALGRRIAHALDAFAGPLLVILAEGDATAIGFAAQWRGRGFASIRDRQTARLVTLDTAAHSFAREGDGEALAAACLDWLAAFDSPS